MRAAASILALAAVAPVALAGPFFTSPVAGTTCVAGQQCTISWNEDNIAPLLAEYGDCTIGIYAGSHDQQSLMQQVAPANAGSTGSVIFTPDPAMGENSSSYFIKMISVNTADPAQPQYKATAYSSMFTLNGMTGTFSDTVKAQIAGTAGSSGAAPPGASSTPAASSAPATTSSAVITSVIATRASTTVSATRSASASASASAAANGASSVAVAGMGVFGATVAAVIAALL